MVIVNTEPTGTVISVGAHGGSPNPGANQPESINLTSDQQPVSECSDTDQPASISANANLSSSDMDIVSIYAAVLASYLTVFRQLWSKATPV